MGVWGRMADGTAIHIDFAVRKNCWNLEAMCYGNCYGCGCCVNDKRQRCENRIAYLEEMLDQQYKFDMWDDDPDLRKIQERNIAANIRLFKRKLRYYRRKLAEVDSNGI